MEKICDNFNLNSNNEVCENTQGDSSPSGENTLENNISSSSSEDIQPIKRGRGKPRQESAVWRYKENGTYDGRPIDPEYSKKYMNVRVPCPNCGVQVPRGHVSRHKKAKPCKLRTLQNMLNMP